MDVVVLVSVKYAFLSRIHTVASADMVWSSGWLLRLELHAFTL